MIQISALPAFTDNYIWLLQDPHTQRCAVVDPGDATPVLAWLKQNPQWALSDILITHHHHDHVGGVEQLKRVTNAKVYGPANENIPARDVALQDNDRISVLGLDFDVYSVPGHTLGHIAFYPQGLLFCGDTLFSGGCGRLFEGTPEQMYQSLQKINALPAETVICCAHEYTLGNMKFAASVLPEDRAIQDYYQKVKELRAKNQKTLPTTLKKEREINIFLRTQDTDLIDVINKETKLQQANARFGWLRSKKYNF